MTPTDTSPSPAPRLAAGAPVRKTTFVSKLGLRFRLGGLLVFILFVGSLQAIWVRRERWVLVGPYTDAAPIWKTIGVSTEPLITRLPQIRPNSSALNFDLKALNEQLVVVSGDRQWCITVKNNFAFYCRNTGSGAEWASGQGEPAARLELNPSPTNDRFLIEWPFQRSELYSADNLNLIGQIRPQAHFSRDGKSLLAAEGDTVYVYDALNGKLRFQFTPFGSFDPKKEAEQLVNSPEWNDVPEAARPGKLASLKIDFQGDIGEHLVWLSRKESPVIFDYQTGKRIATLSADCYPGYGETFSRDEDACFLFDPEHFIYWDIKQKKPRFVIDPVSAAPERPAFNIVCNLSQSQDRLLVTSCITAGSYMLDTNSGATLHSFANASDANFKDNDTLIVKASVNDSEEIQLWRRHYPEWWWGHLCRAEVWLAVVFGSLWLWRTVRWIGQRRKTAVAAP